MGWVHAAHVLLPFAGNSTDCINHYSYSCCAGDQDSVVKYSLLSGPCKLIHWVRWYNPANDKQTTKDEKLIEIWHSGHLNYVSRAARVEKTTYRMTRATTTASQSTPAWDKNTFACNVHLFSSAHILSLVDFFCEPFIVLRSILQSLNSTTNNTMLTMSSNPLRYAGPVYMLKWSRIAGTDTPLLPRGTNISANTANNYNGKVIKTLVFSSYLLDICMHLLSILSSIPGPTMKPAVWNPLSPARPQLLFSSVVEAATYDLTTAIPPTTTYYM